MGTGYSQPLTQWSKGEYSGATNTQDDFVIMDRNGATPRPDDHGNTPAAATPLPGPTVDLHGVIGVNPGGAADVDMFRFTTTGGPVTFTAAPAPLGPNLDVRLDLLNSNEQTVTTIDPATSLTATLTQTLPAGTYTLVVAGAAKGTPDTGYTNYGSVGRYRLTGSFPAGTGNQPPTARIGADKTSGRAPLDVTFNTEGSSDVDGTIVQWNWNFGDGTTLTRTNGTAVTHRYQTTGTFQATLTVTDDEGATTTSAPITITVLANTPPTAAADASPSSGVAPLTTTLTAINSRDADGDALTYRWTVNNTQIGTTRDVTHTFSQHGTHLATVTVTDSHGASATASVVVTVQQQEPPTARMATSATNGPAPLTVTFDGSGSTDPNGEQLTYRWTFGNGATATGVTASHTYTTAGTFQATLTVTDPAGNTSTAASTITVTATEPAPAAPSNVTATHSSGTVKIAWTDRSTNETGFEVIRESLHKNGKWMPATPVTTTGPNVTSVTDTPGAGTFRYSVRAVNGSGTSSYATSGTVTATSTGNDSGGGSGGGGRGGPKK